MPSQNIQLPPIVTIICLLFSALKSLWKPDSRLQAAQIHINNILILWFLVSEINHAAAKTISHFSRSNIKITNRKSSPFSDRHAHGPLAERLMHKAHRMGNTTGVLKSEKCVAFFNGPSGNKAIMDVCVDEVPAICGDVDVKLWRAIWL